MNVNLKINEPTIWDGADYMDCESEYIRTSKSNWAHEYKDKNENYPGLDWKQYYEQKKKSVQKRNFSIMSWSEYKMKHSDDQRLNYCNPGE